MNDLYGSWPKVWAPFRENQDSCASCRGWGYIWTSTSIDEFGLEPHPTRREARRCSLCHGTGLDAAIDPSVKQEGAELDAIEAAAEAQGIRLPWAD